MEKETLRTSPKDYLKKLQERVLATLRNKGGHSKLYFSSSSVFCKQLFFLFTVFLCMFPVFFAKYKGFPQYYANTFVQ